MRNLPDESESELYYIYTVLGRLRSLLPTTIDRLSVNQSIFPNRFVYKLIDDRLKELKILAENLATALFRRLNSEPSQRTNERLVDASARQHVAKPSATGSGEGGSCPELDEYFHCALCNIHDFLINLDWHEPILDDRLKKSDEKYINSKIPHMKEFIEFRKKLLVDKNTIKIAPLKVPDNSMAKSSAMSTLDNNLRVLRSNLATKRSPESPGAKRRVRFNVSKGPAKDLPQDNPRLRKCIRDSHSILALDLTLFALHMFAAELKRQLSIWSTESTASMKESMGLIRLSRRKLRVNRLIAMAKDREVSNAVHANILNNLTEMESVYLIDHVLGTVYAHDEERLLKLYKQPHVRTFVNEFTRNDEKEILNLVATQILDILFELAICEINMPPIELIGNRRTKPKEVGADKTGPENYLNFVASWLNLDKILFGSKVKTETMIKQTAGATTLVKAKSADAGFDFKSSSRLLNQMDNLHELMRHILTDLVSQINCKRHLEYCLHLLHRGMGKCLESIANQLETQLNSTKKVLLAQQKQALREASSIEQLNLPNMDRIAIKIRYLKLIHISSSMDNLIKEFSQIADIASNTDSMVSSSRLMRLIDECTRQMESI